MKKLLLLFMTGATVLSASAQQNQSVVFGANVQEKQAYPGMTVKHIDMSHSRANATANKTTSGGADWFSFVNSHDLTLATNAFLPNVPDTILYVPAGTPPFYWWCHGLGASFDPTSTWFAQSWANADLNPPSIIISNNDAYTIDSVEVAGYYRRYKTNLSAPDTLFVELVAITSATTNGALAHWHGGFMQGQFSNDTVVRSAQPFYNYAGNTLDVPGTVKLTIILDAAAANDTNANGFQDWVKALPTALSVPAGGKVVAFTHFSSTQTQPWNAVPSNPPVDLDSVNYWESLTYDLGFTPFQGIANIDTVDFNEGLLASSEDRTNSSSPYTSRLSATQVTLSPAYLYTPDYVHDPYYNFHITCPTCYAESVKNVSSNIAANAYPNPAVSQIIVPFTITKSSNVTVTLTNTLGQVVATQNMGNVTTGKAVFSTTTLPNGVYFYSVNANGERTTGRVAVSH